MNAAEERGISSRTIFVQDPSKWASTIVPLLEKGRQSYRDVHTPVTMWWAILQGHLSVFLIVTKEGKMEEVVAIAVVEKAQTATWHKLLVHAVVGKDVYKWWKRIGDLDKIARHVGADRIEIVLREGWWRFFSRLGYKRRIFAYKEVR